MATSRVKTAICVLTVRSSALEVPESKEPQYRSPEFSLPHQMSPGRFQILRRDHNPYRHTGRPVGKDKSNLAIMGPQACRQGSGIFSTELTSRLCTSHNGHRHDGAVSAHRTGDMPKPGRASGSHGNAVCFSSFWNVFYGIWHSKPSFL